MDHDDNMLMLSSPGRVINSISTLGDSMNLNNYQLHGVAESREGIESSRLVWSKQKGHHLLRSSRELQTKKERSSHEIYICLV